MIKKQTNKQTQLLMELFVDQCMRDVSKTSSQSLCNRILGVWATLLLSYW